MFFTFLNVCAKGRSGKAPEGKAYKSADSCYSKSKVYARYRYLANFLIGSAIASNKNKNQHYFFIPND